MTAHSDNLKWRQTFLGRGPEDVYMLVDSGGVGMDRGQLRTIPFLRELGLTRFSYPTAWHVRFKPVDYDYVSPEQTDSDLPEALLISGVEEGRLGYGRQMIERYQASGSHKLFIVVTDSDTFRLRGNDRYLQDAPPLGGRVFHYDRLLSAYMERQHVLTSLPLTSTKNLAFHRLAQQHEAATNVVVRSLADLFPTRKAHRTSPIWQFVLGLPWDTPAEDLVDTIRRELMPWEERGDVMQVAQNLKYVMSLFHYEMDELKEWLANAH